MRRRILTAVGAVALLVPGLAVSVSATSVAAAQATVTADRSTPAGAPAARPAPAHHDLSALRSSVRVQLQQALTRQTPDLDPAAAALPEGPDGQVQVDVTGTAAEVRAAVEALGGRILAVADGISSARIAKTQLAGLAASAAVTRVAAPVRGYPQGVISQGVAKSGANQWQAAGRRGAGVKIAIVDGGFAGLSAEQAVGNLPGNSRLTYKDVNCAANSAASTQHGTAVAEIVHQMAPSASLYLYCIWDTTGFAAAANDIIAKGIPIATSSLGFPGDSRGDGTGAPGTAAATVKKAAQAGVFWIQSAGNNALEHWSGMMVDALTVNPTTGTVTSGADGLVDIGCEPTHTRTPCAQADAFYVPAGGSAGATLKWDDWVNRSTSVTLQLWGYDCESADTCSVPVHPAGDGSALPLNIAYKVGSAPTLTRYVQNSSDLPQRWDVTIKVTTSNPGMAFDLSYWDEVSDPSYLASWYPEDAAAGSVTEPASSPYAFAVGAAAAQAVSGGVPVGDLEPFSSRGPTIDGRVKPEMTGWDCTRSNLSEFSGAFCGTSAAAPHVAGAAALAKAADPGLAAAGLKHFLLARANGGNPISPAENGPGAGNLTLGFFDVLPSNSFFADIDWLTDRKITGGYRDGGFHPADPVSRQAMASFLFKLANPGATAPPCTRDAFSDVPQASQFCAVITWLAQRGITTGYPDGSFHPADPVSRQAMAAFLYRFGNPNTEAPPCSTDPFTDVRVGDRFCPDVQWLVGTGVTTGYSDGGYHPAVAVSRQAMAAFLHRFPAPAP